MTDKKNILIVEDDLRSIKLQKKLLEYAGYGVIIAGSAESGIALARRRFPDLIIMDFRLPRMGGDEAFEILMADETTKNIPVVFVTASVIDDDRKRLESYGCKVITKPINTRIFVQEIEEVLYAPR